MAHKTVPLNILHTTYMWTDGNQYASAAGGTAELPAGLIKALIAKKEWRVTPESTIAATAAGVEVPDDYVGPQPAQPQTVPVAATMREGEASIKLEQGDPGASIGGHLTSDLGQGADPNAAILAQTVGSADAPPPAAVPPPTPPAADSPPEVPLPDDFPGRKALLDAGYDTVRKVSLINVTDVPGIAAKTAEAIQAWFAEHGNTG